MQDSVQVAIIECEPLQGAVSANCVCAGNAKGGQLEWPGNAGVVAFLTELRHNAKPQQYDPATDRQAVDSSGRVANQRLVEAAFEALITVEQC